MQPPDHTKPCPYCAETIKAAAIVCRYCGRDLVDDVESAVRAPRGRPPRPARRPRASRLESVFFWIGLASFVLVMVVVVSLFVIIANLPELSPIASRERPSIAQSTPTPIELSAAAEAQMDAAIARAIPTDTRVLPVVADTAIPTDTPIPTNTVAPIPTDTPFPTHTFTPIPTDTSAPPQSAAPLSADSSSPTEGTAPTCAEMLNAYRLMTNAQWQAYRDMNRDTWVQNLQGSIRRVSSEHLFGGYTVTVDVARDCNVEFEVQNQEDALRFSLDQPVVVSGQINRITTGLFGDIYMKLKDDTVTIR